MCCKPQNLRITWDTKSKPAAYTCGIPCQPETSSKTTHKLFIRHWRSNRDVILSCHFLPASRTGQLSSYSTAPHRETRFPNPLEGTICRHIGAYTNSQRLPASTWKKRSGTLVGVYVCTSKAVIISSLTHNVAFLFFCISDCFVFSFTQDWCGDKPLFLLYHANACSRAGILSTSMHWDVALQRYDSQLPRLSYFPFDVLTALSFSLSDTNSFSHTQVSNLVCCLPSELFKQTLSCSNFQDIPIIHIYITFDEWQPRTHCSIGMYWSK